MPKKATVQFPGFSSPNFTQVPDEFFDILMPQLSDAELRVLLYIIRRTFGFKRDCDDISLSQMVSGITTKDGQVLDTGTGLSKATVARGLKGLREKGVVTAIRNRSEERGDMPTTYRLRMKTGSSDLSQNPPLSQQRDTTPVSRARQGLSRRRDTQNTVRQKTDFEYSKREKVQARAKRADPPQSAPVHDAAEPHRTRSSSGMESLAENLAKRRTPVAASSTSRSAIEFAVKQIADELGDKATTKATMSRAIRLFEESGLHSNVFIDALFQAKGEVVDRRRNPGKAPLPRNQMAYFFAVVEDRLGVRRRGSS